MNLENEIGKKKRSKYANVRIFYDERRRVAYRDIEYSTAEFRSLKRLDLSSRKQCLQFDSIHEYRVYRILSHVLTAPGFESFKLYRQVAFKVVDKSDLGGEVTYRADFVVSTESVETVFRPKAYLGILDNFLVVEAKGVLTDKAKLKHLMLCSLGKIPIANILFVTCLHLLEFPESVQCSLAALPKELIDRLRYT